MTAEIMFENDIFDCCFSGEARHFFKSYSRMDSLLISSSMPWAMLRK